MFDAPPFRLPRIYPITDVRICGLSHAEQVERFIGGGATLVQLREKNASPREFYDSARDALKLAKRTGVPLIINDRVDIAMALKADGVHLGQDDLPPEKARAILGRDAIIGFSTHSVDQAIAAARQPVDYVAIGPIFATRTKTEPDDVVGIGGLRAVRAAIGGLPLVAIGGIDEDNIRSVFEAGADSAVIIAALLSEPARIEAQMRVFISLAG